eukprot:maker-scaffold895_size84271-snap-gene-0.22 protein:Tk08198 transcript:maker-scaffold895_size84271-snap-gene-0.22-mRNA-1 annotation:"coiled-coil-helix-coiled-coil-helix domain-containing protein mitochondrial"
MGQSQSNPRKITVINEEAAGVIKISDSVVQRLKEEMGGQKDKPDPPQTTESASPAPAAPPAPAVIEPTPPQVGPAPIIQYVGDPSLSALKVRAEKEEELRQVEDYWQSRLRETRNHQLKATAINEENFHSTIEAVERLFLKSRQSPICQEAKHAVLQCYKQNPKQSLKCSQEVRNFAQCIDSARLNSLNSRKDA